MVEEEVQEETDFAKLAMKKLIPKAVKDQYQEYTTGSRVLQDPGNLFHWWAGQTNISTMQQMAFAHLCIPATSREAERAFSGCKYTISDHRSRLGEDILEAFEQWSSLPIQAQANPVYRIATEMRPTRNINKMSWVTFTRDKNVRCEYAQRRHRSG